MDTLSKIKEIICERTDIKPELLTEETTLEETGADSIDIIEILMALEDAFDIDIPDSDAERLRNIGELKEYIEEKL
ncbi:MAG: acyl carrier protein [Clostridia bacterium]|nr:acyl carrier protein [Clostridia bacterium]